VGNGRPDDGKFIEFVTLVPSWQPSFTACTEIA